MAALMHADFYPSLVRFGLVSIPDLSISGEIPQKRRQFSFLSRRIWNPGRSAALNPHRSNSSIRCRLECCFTAGAPRLAVSTYAGRTPHSEGPRFTRLNKNPSNRRRAYGSAHACRFLLFAGPFWIGSDTRPIYQRGDPAKETPIFVLVSAYLEPRAFSGAESP